MMYICTYSLAAYVLLVVQNGHDNDVYMYILVLKGVTWFWKGIYSCWCVALSDGMAFLGG